jgi:hypothetical protein
MENHAAFAAGLAKLRGNPSSVCKFILFDQLYLCTIRQLTSFINLIKARPRVDSEDVISLTASDDGQPPSNDPEMNSFVRMLQLEEESKKGRSRRVGDTPVSSNQTKKKVTKKEQKADAVAKKVKEQQDLAKAAAASNQVHRPHTDLIRPWTACLVRSQNHLRFSTRPSCIWWQRLVLLVLLHLHLQLQLQILSRGSQSQEKWRS